MLLETSLQRVLIFYPTRIAPFGLIRERTDQQPKHKTEQLVPFFRDLQTR